MAIVASLALQSGCPLETFVMPSQDAAKARSAPRSS
jgi:hypothetical protein